MSESENESRPAKQTKKKVGSAHTADAGFQQEGVCAAPRERAQGHSQTDHAGGPHWRQEEGSTRDRINVRGKILGKKALSYFSFYEDE